MAHRNSFNLIRQNFLVQAIFLHIFHFVFKKWWCPNFNSGGHMCKWHLCEYYTFGEQPGFHSLKPLGRTRMLQGLNLQPLAFARLTQTTQPWWHHSPHCHTSLIASLLSANLCSSSNLLTTDDSLNVSVQVNISGCLCCTAVVSKDVPHLSVQSLRSSVFVQATSSHQAN